MSLPTLKGVIFDLDGVITATAHVHAKAWENMFNEFLKRHAELENKHFIPFDPKDDYLQYVDGKPRYQGVKSFLQSRGYELPFGAPEDTPDMETICGLGNKKNVEFQAILRKDGPTVYDTSVEFIKALKNKGIRVGVASSSKNCKVVLEMAGLLDEFETRVDGVVSQEMGLKGKPDPDIFTTAAKNLDLNPGECVVVEDAISGVQAGRAGNFGLVLGVAREVDGGLLKQFGADIVVSDLGEIDMVRIGEWFAMGINVDGWQLRYDGFDPGEEKLRETLCAVGNGYMGTRGCFPGERSSYSFYPGVYLAGVFNQLTTEVHGRDIVNNDFVNCPNWLMVEFKVGAGPYLSPLSMELLSFNQTLDMQTGVLSWSLVCKDKLGRITRVNPKMFTSMASPHMSALRYDITPINYSESVTVRLGIDGNLINDGVARYRELKSKHLEGQASGSIGDADEGVFLHMQTVTSKYDIVMCARTQILEDEKPLAVAKKLIKNEWEISEEVTFQARENLTYSAEKLVSVYTSLDDVKDPLASAEMELAKAKSYQSLHKAHVRAWAKQWEKSNFTITGDRFIQKVARLHAYHLMVTASPHNVNLDAGMPARGLHGEAYRGHIFWDELYIQPFFDRHFPEVSRALLKYRYNRLDAAREYARENGYSGAMYPWQTADLGGEETQELHYNPESKTWGPDLSRRQRHVSIAVFYNVWKHMERTGDTTFMHEYGAEIILEIARFWASIATYDKKTQKYHISGVMGPDEFHEKLPGAEDAGVTDNAYTNVMVVWLMERSLELLKILPAKALAAVSAKIGFDKKETEKWRDMTQKLNVLLTEDGVISQFDGYLELDELDWEHYRKRYYSIHRMDRILKAEGDSPDHYKVAKQADTLMMWYVLPPEEIKRILVQLGYEPGDAIALMRHNYEYYEQRTSHGSTLSKVVHAVISSYMECSETTWDWFMEAMRSDIFDTQGGTTIEGIHTGVMAGTLDVIVRYFAGVRFEDDVPTIEPNMPAHWSYLNFSIYFKRVWYTITVNHKQVTVKAKGRNSKPIRLLVCGKEVLLVPGSECVVSV